MKYDASLPFSLRGNTHFFQQTLFSQVLESIDEGISRLAEGKFALYENVRFLKFIRMTRNLSKNGSPTSRVMKQCIVPVHIGFAYQKNSAITLTVDR